MATDLEVAPAVACPLCDGLDSTRILRLPDSFAAGGVLEIARCDGCSLVYLEKQLTDAGMKQLENENGFYKMPSDVAESTIGRVGPMVECLEGYAPRRGRFLDIGCNCGLLLEAARRRGWHVAGIELSPVAAEHARSHYGLDVRGSFEEFAGAEPLDLAVAWHVLEHTPNPIAFIVQAVVGN